MGFDAKKMGPIEIASGNNELRNNRKTPFLLLATPVSRAATGVDTASVTKRLSLAATYHLRRHGFRGGGRDRRNRRQSSSRSPEDRAVCRAAAPSVWEVGLSSVKAVSRKAPRS
jgi:hypothetical protein